MKKLMMSAVCAMMAAATFAEPSVKITKAYQKVPGSGIVDYTYTVKDLGPKTYNVLIEVGAEGCDKTVVLTNEFDFSGTVTTSVDVKKLLGKAYPNVTLFAELEVIGVRLWANGPVFAECNVGATKPEEAGYYFWWGDTVGYKRSGSSWVSVKDSSSFQFSDSNSKIVTYGMSNADLYSKGYIDANSTSGKLKPAYDAATAHLGAPWRMMTKAELDALVSKCTMTWTTQNGVNGRLVKGNTAGYTDKSIFLPASGYGYGSSLNNTGSSGQFWSSTPDSGNRNCAWYLELNSSRVGAYNNLYRYFGYTVRAVRGSAE